MAAAELCWVRVMPGVYTARGRHDDRWRIVQATSDRWEVYRDGYDFDLHASTLAEAKMVAEEEDDPEARSRREARKAARAFKRGVLFRHGRILDASFVPGPGERFADAPKAVCRVTAVRNGNVYYAVGDESHARSYASAERLLADGAEVLS